MIYLAYKHDDAASQQLAQELAEHLGDHGHRTLLAPLEIARHKLSVHERMRWVKQQLEHTAWLVVLEHPQLRGGLIELGIAHALGVPSVVCHHPGARVSSSALGCALAVLTHHDSLDLAQQLRQVFNTAR